MRIGVLTLHDSVNYGALLQAYALATYLRTQGHEVSVIDRRRNDARVRVRTPPVPAARILWLGFVPVDSHTGAAACQTRIERSVDFLSRQVGLTPYAFSDWRDAPSDLAVDVIVVGSDQVWNANNLDPADYLLLRLRQPVPGIAYAASIGMSRIPEELRETYRRGLARFSAISVREREAVGLLADFDVRVEQVVDPVLLAGSDIWLPFLTAGGGGAPSNKVFAYFLAEDFPSLFKPLCRFAAASGGRVSFFADWFCQGEARGVRGAFRNARRAAKWREAGVDMMADAGPLEFVRCLTSAEVVVTNSYHGLVLAFLFAKQVRVVLPSNPVRQAMNARLLEAVAAYFDGPVVHDSVEAAVRSLERGEVVSARPAALAESAATSRQWLARAIDRVAGSRS